MLVKLDHGTPRFGVKIPKIFELPPTRLLFQQVEPLNPKLKGRDLFFLSPVFFSLGEPKISMEFRANLQISFTSFHTYIISNIISYICFIVKKIHGIFFSV